MAQAFGGSVPWVLQQDKALIYTAIETRRWLTEKHIRTLPWPVKSLDINIIEKSFGFMAWRVYKRR